MLSKLVCWGMTQAIKSVKNAVVKPEVTGTPMAVKITKQCPELREEVDRWNYRRIKELRDMGFKGDVLTDALDESRRFLNMLDSAIETLELGETRKEYWLLFMDDIEKSPDLSFVIRRANNAAEISRHMIHAGI